MDSCESLKNTKNGYLEDVSSAIAACFAEGRHAAFIKDGMKHVVKILSATVSSNGTELSVKASGIVWKGGMFSVDNIDCNGTGLSAARYTLGRPMDRWTCEDWEDELRNSSYFAVYSELKPLVLDRLDLADASGSTNGILELASLEETDFLKAVSGFNCAVGKASFVANMF